ncbi:MAG: NAD(P)/FAD-dependent oxidoreductase [Gammaproteobacteria bacterium]|nr:NAD(P)/FAD-dependent oxidoreductase [Gammaproteobacteria bacterium]
MDRLAIDAVVIGAGVVGLAVARALVAQGLQVAVLEQHTAIGEETSSRNSEVIHAGLYYPPGSVKARLCVAGRDQLYTYCAQRGIPHRRLGKWLVATQDEQLPALERLIRNAAGNGIDLQPVAEAQVRREAPALRVRAVVASNLTGIIDSHALLQALCEDVEQGGGILALRAKVTQVRTQGCGYRLWVRGVEDYQIDTPRVVNASGLHAWDLARNWEGYPRTALPPQGYARGHYFALSGPCPFQRLIYPLPEAAGLGVHLTLDMAGQARFGPDVEWLPATTPGAQAYIVDPARKAAFVEAIRRWWPAIPAEHLHPAYAGIRPKLGGPDAPTPDFLIQTVESHGLPGVIHLFGIESPGLTASLAIADQVAASLA